MLKHDAPFSIYRHTEDIPEAQWNSVLASQSIFLSLPYLRSLEQTLSSSIKLYYILVHDSKKNPILAGVFQLTAFTYKKGSQTNLLLKLFQDCKNKDDSVSIHGLVCGNIFATGKHGFAHTETLTKRAAIELMASAAKEIQSQLKQKDLFSVQLFKDFTTSEIKSAHILDDFKYRPFQADVTMVLPIDEHWINFDTYLQSMKAKYRTKANSAFKKAEKLSIVSLSAAQIGQHKIQLQQLFKNVQDKSDYSYGEQYPLAFNALKQNLGPQFLCKRAFLNDKLVGFSTAFLNNGTLEASYIGLDYKYNISHALYERLLYGYVEDAIAHKSSLLTLGRTSELIKSAMGAVPKEMTLYIKHTSKLKNALLKPIVEAISPSDFELRTPFKATFYKSNDS